MRRRQRGGEALDAQGVDGLGQQLVLGGVVAGGDPDEVPGGQLVGGEFLLAVVAAPAAQQGRDVGDGLADRGDGVGRIEGVVGVRIETFGDP